MKFLFWKECLYIYILVHGDIFWPHRIRGDPKVVEYSISSKMSGIIEFLLKKIYKCKYGAFGSYFLAKWVILTFFWPQFDSVVPQRGSKITIWLYKFSYFVAFLARRAIFDLFDRPIWPPDCTKSDQNFLHEWKDQISHEKLSLCANLQLLGGIFRKMGSWPPFDPYGDPKKVKNVV